MLRLVVLIALALVAGCKERNSQFCDNPANGGEAACRDSGIDGPSCGPNGVCEVGVCKQPDNVCVECLKNTDCGPQEPTCDLGTNTCRTCSAHADCDSNACLASGECADETMVAYVENGGAGTGCTRLAPCATLNDAIATLAMGRTHIKVNAGTGPVTDTAAADFDSVAVTVLADRGAQVTRSTTGPVVAVKNDGANVTIFDLRISNGLSNGGDGITLAGGSGATAAKLTLERVIIDGNGGRGVFAASGGKLVMKQCVVSDNDGGGGNIQGIQIDLSNTLVVRNGSGGVNSGGMTLDPLAGSIFQFNTIANNVSLNAANAGVNCVNPFPAANNIVIGNALGVVCTFSFSLVDVIPAMGSNNKTGNAMFINDNPADPARDDYYRIMPASAAENAADPAAMLADDIDGAMTRPSGAGREMGADELD